MVTESRGFDIKKFFEDLSFNAISVTIGLIVRLALIFFCLITTIIYLILSVIFFVVWWLVPFLGWEYYKNDKIKSQNELNLLDKNIRKNPKDGVKIILNSEGWKFIELRMEKKVRPVLEKIEINEGMLVDFDGSSLEKIFEWLLSRDKKIEGELQKIESSKEDILLAAKWWDRNKFLGMERENEKWSLGRPGLGWDLIFGYTPNLDKYGEDLGIKQDFSDHLIGREKIVSRMERVISGGKNILLVGKPGVGKMTVVYEFAERAITGKLGRDMVYKKLISLDFQSAMAGGTDKDVKKKILTGLMREAEAAGNIVLVMKDLFRITNAAVEGTDYVDVIDKVLETGKVKIVAVTGKAEYERFMAKDERILKNFEVVEVEPSTKEEALLILFQAVVKVERKSKVIFLVEAVKQILNGSDKYITETPFPEKALELMDVVAMEKFGSKSVVTLADVNKVLSEKTGVSVGSLSDSEKEKLGNIEETIKKGLVGQEIAVSLIGKSLRSRLATVKSDNRPLGSFLFLGPTGVGKTQTAKVLAEVYFGSKENILRFDMAEYVGKEGLERLVGSVESNQPGTMTTQIRNKPVSLLLLDEMEKAPPEVYNLFLTLLDEGYINDAWGNKIIASHLFVVATSNAGAVFIRDQIMEGVKGEELQKSVVAYVQEKGIFSPEFLNRFDGVVVFEPLDRDNLKSVGKLMLEDFKNNLAKKNINIDFDETVMEKLVNDGYVPEFGARPMRRVVDLDMGDVIAKELVANRLLPGDKAVMSVENDQYVIKKNELN